MARLSFAIVILTSVPLLTSSAIGISPGSQSRGPLVLFDSEVPEPVIGRYFAVIGAIAKPALEQSFLGTTLKFGNSAKKPMQFNERTAVVWES